MDKDREKSKKLADLRKRAEEIAQMRAEGMQELPVKDIQHLVHEMQLYQIELEMQNEELRRAQNELEESRNKYADLYDFAPVGYFTFDKNGLIMDVNLTGARKLDMERSFLIKKPFSFYIAQGSKDTFYSHLRHVLSTRTRQTCELKLVDKNKTQFDAQLESTIMQDSEGKPGRYRTAISDITERKHAEEELRKAKELSDTLNNINTVINSTLDFDKIMQRAIMESAKAMGSETTNIALRENNFWALKYATGRSYERIGTKFSDKDAPLFALAAQTKKAIIIEDAYSDERVNNRIMEIQGIRSLLVVPLLLRGDVIGITGFTYNTQIDFTGIHVDFANKLAASLSLAMENSSLYEALHEAHDKLEIRIQGRTAELEKANKSLQAEISERKRGEEQIREQADLLDKAQDAITVRDLDGRIIYWNKGGEHLYGWTAEEATGKNADELLHKEESPELIEAKKSVIKEGEWMGELRQRTKGGKEITVESRWTLMHDSERKPRSILIINTDITEKKKLEIQLLRAQRLESIGTLAGGIAHDINNVLTPIMLSIGLLQDKLTDKHSQKLLGIIEASSQRGASLVKQIMLFARGEGGEREDLQVTQIISEIDKIVKGTFTRSIEVKTIIPQDLWTVYGDITQLHQLMMNLCVNARDAMPGGGILRLSAENVLFSENDARINIDARAGPYVVITALDTGTGIPPEIMDKIFDPFFTTKQHGKGTGLGLSTVLGIVRNHGGFIDVQSVVEEGTIFRIYLPAKKQEHKR